MRIQRFEKAGGDGYLSRNGNLFAKLFACCVDTKEKGGKKNVQRRQKKKKERKKEKERYTQRTIHREFRVEFLSACIGSRHLGVPFKAENDDIQDRILLCGHGVYIYRTFYRSFFFFSSSSLTFLRFRFLETWSSFLSLSLSLSLSFNVIFFFWHWHFRASWKKKRKEIWARTYELFNIQCLLVFQYDLGYWIYKFVGKEENWILFEKYRQRTNK